MLNIKGITEQKAEKLYEAASKIESMGYVTGMQILEKRKKIKRITTGSKQFDLLLCMVTLLSVKIVCRGWCGESRHHRGLRRVQNRQDLACSHSLCYISVAQVTGWRRGKSPLHRH